MYSKGEGVPEDFVMAYAWAYLVGANDSDATKFKEHLVLMNISLTDFQNHLLMYFHSYYCQWQQRTQRTSEID